MNVISIIAAILMFVFPVTTDPASVDGYVIVQTPSGTVGAPYLVGEYPVASEISASPSNAVKKTLLPVDATSDVEIDVPAGYQPGEFFEISYSNSSAAGTITIDFIGGGYNYYSNSTNPTIVSMGTVRFIYLDPTIGFVAK